MENVIFIKSNEIIKIALKKTTYSFNCQTTLSELEETGSCQERFYKKNLKELGIELDSHDYNYLPIVEMAKRSLGMDYSYKSCVEDLFTPPPEICPKPLPSGLNLNL